MNFLLEVAKQLQKRASDKKVAVGNRIVFGVDHVEIMTKIQKNWIADDGFCAIGAGRGGNGTEGRDNMGSIRCDGFFSDERRELGYIFNL